MVKVDVDMGEMWVKMPEFCGRRLWMVHLNDRIDTLVDKSPG